jgi:hypothetical protein
MQAWLKTLAMAAVCFVACGCAHSVWRYGESETVGLTYYGGRSSGYYGRHPSFPRTENDTRPCGHVEWQTVPGDVPDEWAWKAIVGCRAKCIRPFPWEYETTERVPLCVGYWMILWYGMTAVVEGEVLAVDTNTAEAVIDCGRRVGLVTNDLEDIILTGRVRHE